MPGDKTKNKNYEQTLTLKFFINILIIYICLVVER